MKELKPNFSFQFLHLYDMQEWFAFGEAGGFKGLEINFGNLYPIGKTISVHEIEPEKPIILDILTCNFPGDGLGKIEVLNALLQITDWNVLALVEDTYEFVLRNLLQKKALKKIFVFKKEEPELKSLTPSRGMKLNSAEMIFASQDYNRLARPLQVNSNDLKKIVDEFKITHVTASAGWNIKNNGYPFGILEPLSWTPNDEEIQWGETLLRKKGWENQLRKNLIAIHPKCCGTGDGHPAAWYPELSKMGIAGRKRQSKILLEALVNEFPEKKIILLGHFLAEGDPFLLFEHDRVLNCVREVLSFKESVIMASFCSIFLTYTVSGFGWFPALLPNMKGVLIEGDRWKIEDQRRPYLKTFDKLKIVSYLEPTSNCDRIMDAIRTI